MPNLPESLEVRTTIDLADWEAYRAALAEHASRRPRWQTNVLYPGLLLLGAAVVWVLVDALEGNASVLAILAGIAVLALAQRISVSIAGRWYQPRPHGSIFAPGVLRFSSQGINVDRPGSSSHLDWRHYEGTTQTPTHVFIWVDRVAGYIVPCRDLPHGLTAKQFCEAMESFARQGASVDSPRPESGGPADESVSTAPATGWMRRTLGPRSPVRGARLVLAVTVALLVWTSFDLWRTGAGAVWYPAGFPGVAWYLLAALGVAWLMAATSRPAPSYSALAVRVVLAGLSAILCLALIDLVGSDALWQGWAFGLSAAGALYFARYLSRATGRRQILAPLLGALAVIVFWWLTAAFYLTADLWYVPDASDDEAQSSWEQSEPLLFEQPEKIDAAVAAMQAGDGDAPRAWFVGFGGVGGQRVFANEIDLASRVVGQRYRSGRRAIRLVNDQRNLEAWPLGTVTGLSRALAGVGRRMNTAQDVLFLALSSHGSEDAELSVSNGGMPLLDLTGQDLADALRRSGIRWKVIIISACHAGSFIDYLKDDSTIIITAAAADRTSFGCSDDSDLTYFGEAFYQDALPKAKSLREAFELAKAAIARREKEEGLEASLPQASFSPALEERLGMLERRTD